jgi:RND family efflux transporter MFP subunit
MSRLAVLAGVAAFAWLAGVSLAGDEPKGLPIKLVTHKVKRDKLQPLIVERGALEAANETAIVCRLKAGARNSTIASTIKRLLVADGDKVKEGQLLIELDDAGVREQLKTAKIDLDKAEFDKVQAEEDHKIQVSQNESDVQSAKLVLSLSELDLVRYLKGDLEQTRQDIKGRLLTAEADLEEAKEALEEAEAKIKKQQATERQVRNARRRVEAFQLVLKTQQAELQNLEKYTRARTETDLTDKVAEARRASERVQQQAKAKEVQARQLQETNKANWQQQLNHYKEIEEEIKKCKIHAPRDGTVFIYAPEPSRPGWQPPVVAEGEPVREGQKLMSIPDLSKMQVVVRVPEALVAQVRPGMAAVVRIDAFPDRMLRGRVGRVAPTPMPHSRQAPDEKACTTVIQIDGDTAGLLPGMSATAAIPIGKALDDVLTLPVRALIGRADAGKTVSCLVLTADGAEEREVVVGRRDEKVVEITAGLREGEEVVVNPQLLLSNIHDRMRFLPH